MANDSLKEKFAELTKKLEGVRRVYLLCHDNPDPDSLASMLALRYLLAGRFKIHSRLIYGGLIDRAENRAMVSLLKIPVTSIERVRLREDVPFAMVDTQPGAQNHSLPGGSRVLLVFDHHPLKKSLVSTFYHVHEDLGATSTLMLSYLQEAGLEIDPRLATALVYALTSETQDLGREARREDIQAYQRLIPKVRLRTLAHIKYPPLSLEYFRGLGKALSNTFYYKNLVVTRLGEVETTDMIHQMADLFLRFERHSWSLCIGWNSDYILLSLRSSNVQARCGRMIRRIVRGKGTAGGHDMVAGGRIDCRDMTEKDKGRTVDLVINRLIRALGHEIELELMLPILD